MQLLQQGGKRQPVSDLLDRAKPQTSQAAPRRNRTLRNGRLWLQEPPGRKAAQERYLAPHIVLMPVRVLQFFKESLGGACLGPTCGIPRATVADE